MFQMKDGSENGHDITLTDPLNSRNFAFSEGFMYNLQYNKKYADVQMMKPGPAENQQRFTTISQMFNKNTTVGVNKRRKRRVKRKTHRDFHVEL